MAGQGNFFYVDWSINAPSLASLGTLLQTIPVNPSRRKFFVQNQSATVAYAVFDDGVSSTPTIVALGAASTAGSQGGYTDDAQVVGPSGVIHRGRIRIYGTAGAQIGAAEL